MYSFHCPRLCKYFDDETYKTISFFFLYVQVCIDPILSLNLNIIMIKLYI